MDIETRTLKRDRRLFCVLVLIRSQVIYISEADSSPNTSCFWMLQDIHPLKDFFFWLADGSSSNVGTGAFRLRLEKATLSASALLMCLPSNTTRRPGLNRSLLLQTTSSTRRFGLRGKLLQSVHRDTILQRRLVRGMEENPTKSQTKITQVSLGSLLVVTILSTDGEGLKNGWGTHFGTTGSSGPFAASIASFHLAVHRHHLQPGSRPIDRKLFPREALKSRNSFVRTPVRPQKTRNLSHQPRAVERSSGGGRDREGWNGTGDTNRQRHGYRRLRALRDSIRRGRSPSWAFGRRGRGVF